ncbi:MAG: ATP-binding protein [Verrucomicrobiota bacterium]
MPRSDLLLSLVRASQRGDQGLLQKAVEAIAAEERAKRHHILADQLLTALKETGGAKYEPVSKLSGTLHGPLWYEIDPKRSLASLILPDSVSLACAEMVEEQMRADLLRSHGVEPRHRLLFSGPPGNGKTVLAEALAEALMVPLIIPRYESIIGSYLGETSTRLGKLFEYVRGRHCVLFLDEFDTLGKERGDPRETGEIKRVVSTLLLQVDALPSYVLIVAATNHPESLDRAVWRRFQIRVELPSPTLAQASEWISREFKRMNWKSGKSAAAVAKQLAPTSFSELEDFCLDIERRVILAQGQIPPGEIINQRLAHWSGRVKS